jgi:hypothetical protein
MQKALGTKGIPTLQRKSHLCIHRKGIARRPQSQFPHSCVCDRFIYSHDRSAYSAAGKYADRSWEYLYRIFRIVSLQCIVFH